MSERLKFEEQHHKLHEETFEEVLDDFADKEEERITIAKETAEAVARFITHKAYMDAMKIEKNNE